MNPLVAGVHTGLPDQTKTEKAILTAIRRYIDIANECPKPFVWTKTADEILAGVARFCHRISESGH